MPAPRKYVDRPAPSVAERQQASRGRKRAAGFVKVEAWLEPAEAEALQAFAAGEGITIAEALKRLVRALPASPNDP